MNNEVIGVIAGAIITLIVALLKRKHEKKKHELELENLQLTNQGLKKDNQDKVEKISFYDDVLKLVFYNAINDAVQDIFKKTKVDRFLILLARNGKTDFNYVDVMLEFHKNPNAEGDAVRIHKNVELDDSWKQMLKDTEYYGFVDLETVKMQTQILKYYYQGEKIYFSRIKPALRLPIDGENDFLVYTSYSTGSETNFTHQGLSVIDMLHNSIIKPSIKSLLSE